jgi:hypothetical protein
MLVYLCRYCCANWSALVHLQMKCTHLKIVKESYGSHLRFTVQLCFDFLFLAVVSIIHGLCPWILTGKVSDRIKELNVILNERWLNPDE